MPEIFLTVIKAGLAISVFLLKFGIGLSIAPGDLRFIRERPGLMLKSLAAVTVLVPIAVLAIVLLVQPPPRFAIGLAILAASPAAPMIVGKVKKSGGSAGYAASLQLVVTLLAVISTPLVLEFLSWALHFKAEIDPLRVAWQVFITIFLPIGLGVMVGAKLPRLGGLGTWLVKIATFIFLAILLLILTQTAGAFLHMDLRSYLSIVLTVLAALAIGHLLAPKEPEMKTTLALETAMRNPALALLIGALNFPQTKPLPILIPCVVISVLIVTAYAKWQGRKAK
jgi:BASS family bile acid:Na+ symporter